MLHDEGAGGTTAASTHDAAARRWEEERTSLAGALQGAQEQAGALSAEMEEGRRRERALEVRTMLLTTHDAPALAGAFCNRWGNHSRARQQGHMQKCVKAAGS